MITYEETLTHVAQYQTFSNTTDSYGEQTSATTITTISCFVYFNEVERVIDGVRQTGDRGWQVILPTSMSTICQGDRLMHVVDSFGLVVLEQARMKDIIVYRHWFEGVEVVRAGLDLN